MVIAFLILGLVVVIGNMIILGRARATRERWLASTPDERIDMELAAVNKSRWENDLPPMTRDEYIAFNGLGESIAA